MKRHAKGRITPQHNLREKPPPSDLGMRIANVVRLWREANEARGLIERSFPSWSELAVILEADGWIPPADPTEKKPDSRPRSP